jgi:hypothetical protein
MRDFLSKSSRWLVLARANIPKKHEKSVFDGVGCHFGAGKPDSNSERLLVKFPILQVVSVYFNVGHRPLKKIFLNFPGRDR